VAVRSRVRSRTSHVFSNEAQILAAPPEPFPNTRRVSTPRGERNDHRRHHGALPLRTGYDITTQTLLLLPGHGRNHREWIAWPRGQYAPRFEQRFPGRPGRHAIRIYAIMRDLAWELQLLITADNCISRRPSAQSVPTAENGGAGESKREVSSRPAQGGRVVGAPSVKGRSALHFHGRTFFLPTHYGKLDGRVTPAECERQRKQRALGGTPRASLEKLPICVSLIKHNIVPYYKGFYFISVYPPRRPPMSR